MGFWESVAVGAFAVLILFLYRPGLRAAMEKSRQAEKQDWQALVTPLLLVVLFVLLLIVIAKSTSSQRTVQPDDLIDTSVVPNRAPGFASLR